MKLLSVQNTIRIEVKNQKLLCINHFSKLMVKTATYVVELSPFCNLKH